VGDRLGIAQMAIASSAPGLAAPFRFAFRNTSDEAYLFERLLAVVRERGIETRNAAIAYTTDEVIGRSMGTSVFPNLLQAAGIPVTGTVSFPVAAFDMSAQVAQMRGAAPDLVCMGGPPEPAIVLVREMRRQGMRGRIVGGTTIVDVNLPSRMGADGNGTLVSSTHFYNFDSPRAIAFRDEFVRRAQAAGETGDLRPGMYDAAAHSIETPARPVNPDATPGLAAGVEAEAPAGPAGGVLGPDHRPLPTGESGEVAIRGPSVTAGYEAADLSGWVTATNGESWFLTGDEGYLDQEGRLFLTGRLKEMINRGGEKVIPRRVDEALLLHPAVDQALAFAVTHPTLGEDLAAAVVLRACLSLEEQELRQHAFSVLAPHEVPSRILFLQELPRGATGKLQRIGLAEQLADALRSPDEPAVGELEELVAAVIADVLDLKSPGRDANFFLLGGDSLSGTRVITRLAEHLSLDLQPSLLFTAPTVRTLAERLDRLLDETIAQLEGAQ
jgi:acyl carrier protein